MGASLPSRGRGRARRTPMAEINVTPLVDVMLVLLIIFMITAPLLVAGVPVDLPESRAKALDQDSQPIQIAINKDGIIFVDDQSVREDELAQKLANIAAVPEPAEGRRIFLRADKGLEYGKVMQVMGELNRAGLNRVAMVSVGQENP